MSTNTFTRADVVRSVSKKLSISATQAEELFNSFIETIIEVLESGKNVKISGLGVFKLLDKSPRPGRNPKTLEEVEITQRRVVSFTLGKKLKQMLREKVEG